MITQIRIFFLAGLLLLCTTMALADSFGPGEKVQYAIKKYGVRAGSATLEFVGPTTKEGRDVILIIFESHAMNFFDQEKIYVDPQTFHPLFVDRDLNIFGSKEQISERYLRDQGRIEITKTAGGKVTTQIIEKKGEIDNIYGFLYRCRRSGIFKEGASFAMLLPTKDISVEVRKKMAIGAAGKRYQAYYLESVPAQYRLWFDESANTIPLRIDGAVGFGNASMIMEKYVPASGK